MTTATRAPIDRGVLKDQMIAQFRVVLREMKCVGSQRLLRRGVSMSNLHVLSMLERHGEMSMSRIADALDVSLSNATGLIDRMEERGLVERVRVPDDRRVVLVHLTEDGRQALADIEVFRDEAIGRVIDQLDERQLGRLATTISDLTEAVRRVTAADPDLIAHNHQFHESPAGQSVRG